ncbi:quinone oxidoreductase PIG3 [Fusarium tjaetaba]|uniref:Quinone oxidoreductase PIG3 n=1 Tax=Fusarium tjaetaba TaxID=1567544 RepID=A0A8H5Q5R2_9HYPO|nr:quinone oxidoreductase PIG3 [Fusarium tjaetaba]KAF5610090.1 quinone oxidoreductase PIG3 [Fusarium tjaetaba]
MRAILISEFGPVDNLVIKDIPKPSATVPGTALIRIKAFGINHAEMHMRRGEWAESVPISGIECVGSIEECPGGEFPPGTPVAALMGGLGRTIPGSYAEYTVANTSNMVALGNPGERLPLSWADVAALPESYATAWTCLFRNLDLQRGQRILIRGATSSLGRAAISLAIDSGAIVTATSRSEAKFAALRDLGVADTVLETADLSKCLLGIHDFKKFDSALDLVGNSTIVDSLQLVRRDGHVCLAGWLGGLDPIKGPAGPDQSRGFNPLLQMASGVHLSFFGSFVFGTEEFPLSDVPLRSIMLKVAEGKIDAKPWRVFGFEDIHAAHRAMENGEPDGKMVVTVD